MRKDKKLRQEYRKYPKGYYHLCSDGWKDGKLFEGDRQYAAGVTAIALMTLKCNVSIYGYALMPNHIHILLSGTAFVNLLHAFFVWRKLDLVIFIQIDLAV